MKKYLLLIITGLVLSSCAITKEQPYVSKTSLWMSNNTNTDIYFKVISGGCSIERERTLVMSNTYLIIDDECIYDHEDDFELTQYTIEVERVDSTFYIEVSRLKFGTVSVSL